MKNTAIREVIEARWVRGYEVEFVFDDLKRAKIDLKSRLGRGVFRELLDPGRFKRFRVDAELGTIVWPNGADIAPETLYSLAFNDRQRIDRNSRR